MALPPSFVQTHATATDATRPELQPHPMPHPKAASDAAANDGAGGVLCVASILNQRAASRRACGG